MKNGENMQRVDRSRMGRKACILMMCCLVVLAGCNKKKTAVVPPTPPPAKAVPPPTPPSPPSLAQRVNTPRIVSFTAEPTRIERGQSVTLRWNTTDSDTVTIDQGLGQMPNEGSRQLFPNATTTYVMIARSGALMETRSVTVEVTSAGPTTVPAKPADNAVPTMISQLQEIYFDYDMSEFRDDARRAINTDADLLKRIFAADPRVNFVIEGHADERGSAEYNLGLADRRAIVTRDMLVQMGVSAARLRTISYGEEMPVCRDETEECWQKNRRAHLTAVQ